MAEDMLGARVHACVCSELSNGEPLGHFSSNSAGSTLVKS